MLLTGLKVWNLYGHFSLFSRDLHGVTAYLYCTWMSAGDFVAWGITFLNLSFSHARTKACRNVTKSQCVVYSSMGCHTVILKYMNNETFQMAYFLLDTSVWTCLHVFQTWKFCLRLPHCKEYIQYASTWKSLPTFFCSLFTLIVDFVVTLSVKMRWYFSA